jgi:hypothetical protein
MAPDHIRTRCTPLLSLGVYEVHQVQFMRCQRFPNRTTRNNQELSLERVESEISLRVESLQWAGALVSVFTMMICYSLPIYCLSSALLHLRWCVPTIFFSLSTSPHCPPSLTLLHCTIGTSSDSACPYSGSDYDHSGFYSHHLTGPYYLHAKPPLRLCCGVSANVVG